MATANRPIDRCAAGHVESDLGALAGISDRGHRRSRNEDAMAMGRLPDGSRLAAVVCDGVSSAEHGGLAAERAASVALEVLLGPDGSATRAAARAAAGAVALLATPAVRNAPACTFVSAVVEDAAVTVGWVGDSRAYWLAQAGARLLTADHALAGTHTITRWLGADCEADVELAELEPQGPGALLLCSDGLWNHVDEPGELAAIALPALAEAGPLAAVAALVATALDRGGHDNVTAVVIPVS
jgi:PPM family protein phosphatase